jgi:hypothetical protein
VKGSSADGFVCPESSRDHWMTADEWVGMWPMWESKSRPRPKDAAWCTGVLLCEMDHGPNLSLGWFQAMNSKEISFLFVLTVALIE